MAAIQLNYFFRLLPEQKKQRFICAALFKIPLAAYMFSSAIKDKCILLHTQYFTNKPTN